MSSPASASAPAPSRPHAPAPAPAPAGDTAPSDRVPFGQKVAYGLGGTTENLANSLTNQMFTPVFNIGLGINPAVLSVVQMVFRLWDALSDPVMGNLSDNTRTRWGRRRPYLVVGGALTALAFPLLWQVPRGWGETATIAWLVASGLLFYTVFTVWAMPYYSLGMEMTPDYHERTRIVAYRTFFAKFVGLVSGWLLTLVSLPVFNDPATGKPDLVRGMSVVSWGIGALILCVAMLPGLLVPERYYEKGSRHQPKISLRQSLAITLRCRPFLVLVGVIVLQGVGSGMVGGLGFYILTYYACAGDVAQAGVISGLQGTATFLPGLLSVPLWTWIAQKYTKRGAMKLTLFLAIIGNSLVYVCVTPTNPYLAILPSLFMSAFGFAVWMLIPSMQADVADHDELHTRERREGSFSSVFSWSLKLAYTLTGGISGFILVATGFDAVKYGAEQPAEVLQRMRLLYVFVPLGFSLTALWLLRFYPITEESARETRRLLEARRGKI